MFSRDLIGLQINQKVAWTKWCYWQEASLLISWALYIAQCAISFFWELNTGWYVEEIWHVCQKALGMRFVRLLLSNMCTMAPAHVGYQESTSVSKYSGFILAYVLAHINYQPSTSVWECGSFILVYMFAHIGYQQSKSVSNCCDFILAMHMLAHIATEQHLTKRAYQLSGEKICVVKGCWTIDGQ